MAVVNSECKYILVDVGAEGVLSDGGTLKKSDFGCDLSEGRLDIPRIGRLPGMQETTPFAFVGDEAFQLRVDFMHPYPSRQLDNQKRIFNYRLSRARSCVENAFGITAARWRILLRTIPLHLSNVDCIVKAACILHNFLTIQNPQSQTLTDREDMSGNVVEGYWRRGKQWVLGESCVERQYFPLAPARAQNHHTDAAAARQQFAAYFCGKAGEVPWQWQQPGISKEAVEQGADDCSTDASCSSKPIGAWRNGTDGLDAGDSWRDGSDSWRDGSGASVTTSCTSDACDAQSRRHSSYSMMVSDGSGALLCC
ncbi:uncharacterized protein LOC144095619 [Amblyomma americanum]